LALSATRFAHRASASPPTASDREPYVLRPSGPVPVSPWITSTISGSTPTLSATIWANAVSWPWPWPDVPVYAVTAPVLWTRTIADSQPPACTPTPSGPVIRDGASPQISVYVENPIPR